MERNYAVDEKNCSRLGYFKRLERTLAGDLLTNNPAYRNFMIDYQEPVIHKTKNKRLIVPTIDSILNKNSITQSKERIYTAFKEGLKEKLISNPENQSKIYLKICSSCQDNQSCKNYQDYRRIIEEDDAIVDS